jgi:HD-GYP domain-containing protein (c-di-GMP phosphodiesterase class II)
MALTTIKNFDEYTFNHSLNVGILTLAMGQRLGFDKKNLVKLGTAGLLHDIGKVEINKDLLYKPGKLTAPEWDRLKLHSLYSVRQILKTRGLDEISISALVSAYQHHWNYNGTGYPAQVPSEILPSFLSRIIRICDAYDAMTTPRPYHPIPYIPTLAVRVVWERQGSFFDPILVKIFLQLFGLYPVGSCLELSSGEVAVVLKENPGHIDRPIIKIVQNRDQEPVDGARIDLSVNTDVNIDRAVYPQKYRINPAVYLT